jgi:hypothetical protein
MHSLTLALDGGEWSASCPSPLTPRERALGTHWIGGWVGPRASLDMVLKRKIPKPHQDLNPAHPSNITAFTNSWALTLYSCRNKRAGFRHINGETQIQTSKFGYLIIGPDSHFHSLLLLWHKTTPWPLKYLKTKTWRLLDRYNQEAKTGHLLA